VPRGGANERAATARPQRGTFAGKGADGARMTTLGEPAPHARERGAAIVVLFGGSFVAQRLSAVEIHVSRAAELQFKCAVVLS
jgi:hypothetical protein